MSDQGMTKGPSLYGPELDKPKEFIKDFPIVVAIYNQIDEKPIRVERINFGNKDHRMWIGKITYWACDRGYSVETMAEKDYDAMTK